MANRLAACRVIGAGRRRLLAGAFMVLLAAGGAAEERVPAKSAPVRIGVLAFGTVSWELAAMEAEAPAPTGSPAIVPTVLAGAEAGKVALQGKAVDLIVADWIWVARQRSQGLDFTFVPYSTMHGALVVPADSAIRNVGDLKGKKLGVVGGGLDKNWLMLKLLAKRKYGLDAEQAIEPVFGAPPLLNQQLTQGRIDALLNYWHYAVKLEAQGYRTLLDGRALLRELGVDADLANLGFVFRESWAKQHPEALRALLERFRSAHARLCDNDAAWQHIVPLTQETNPKAIALLRQRYCEGGVGDPPERQAEAAGRLFALLREAGGATFADTALPVGTFWTPLR